MHTMLKAKSIFHHRHFMNSRLKCDTGYTLTRIIDFKGHKQDIYHVVFIDYGSKIATASLDQTIKIWAVETGALINTLTGHIDTVSCVADLPASPFIFSGSFDYLIIQWNWSSGLVIRRFKSISSVKTIGINAELLIAGGFKGFIEIWNWINGDFCYSIDVGKGAIRHIQIDYRRIFMTCKEEGNEIVVVSF